MKGEFGEEAISVKAGTVPRKTATKPRKAAAKQRYHHGDLREALIDATHRLLAEKGADGFSLADACRMAGVSTAAPYRHFSDRGALLEALAGRGFDRMEAIMRASADTLTLGSIEQIVLMGQGYVAFSAEEPALFRLMFGGDRASRVIPEDHKTGASCFQALLDSVAAFRERHDVRNTDLMDIALPLWSFVHGVSSLQMDGAFDKMVPGTDLDRMIDTTTRAFLQGVVLAGENGTAS